jgi:hypothetical protein
MKGSRELEQRRPLGNVFDIVEDHDGPVEKGL